MTLSQQQKKILKARAHHLRPIVLIGQHGLTEAVNKEIDRALYDHELIKMRIAHEDREVRREIYAEICSIHGAELVQLIGNVGVLYRKSDK